MIVIPETKEVTTWRGLHLFHFGMSNCSQRVRIMLEEKALPWESHHVDIPKGENLTDFYQGINPNGVVPTLVHDGTVIIESTDILEYLDTLPSPRESLFSVPGVNSGARDACVDRANAAQEHIKVLSFEYLFKPVARKGKRELEDLDRRLKNRSLLEFHQRFSSGGFSRETLWDSVCAMHELLAFLEGRLNGRDWLAGERISIADVAWIVNVHRLHLMHFPLTRYPKLQRWAGRMRERPSYHRALQTYEPRGAVGIVRLYAWLRANFGRGAFDLAPC